MRDELEILDPTGGEATPVWKLAAGLDTDGEGGRIALLDISKRQGDVFLDQLEELLGARGFTVSRYRKPTMARPADAALVEEIARSCDAAVVALAD